MTMPDYLSSKDWRAVLDQREHKTVKKTGVSDTLDDYASAKKKDDLGRMVSALERIVAKANEVKTAQSKFPKIKAFLDETVKAAKVEEQKLAPRVAQLAEKADTDEDDSTLGKALTRVRQIGPDNAWNFVLVPGRPSSGLVVTRKTLKKSDTDKAFEMKGKRGPFFTGRLYGEAGKFVLDLGPDQQPVPGMAKAAKNAALLHAEMNIRILVRGAGAELDSDTDIEPIEEGEGPTGPAPLTDEGHLGAFTARVQQVRAAAQRFAQSANAKVPGAADGIYGAISLLRQQIAADTKLGNAAKASFGADLDTIRAILDTAAAKPEPAPASKYPDEAYWKTLAEGIMRLDPDKQMDAWRKYKARLIQVEDQFNADAALVDPDRTRVEQSLQRALDIGNKATGRADRLVDKGEESPGDAAVYLRLERKYDLIRSTAGLDPAQVKRLEDSFASLRRAFRDGQLQLDDPRVQQFERALDVMHNHALALRQEASKRKGQQEMHASLSKAMPFLKKAAVPTGIVKDPDAIRGEAAQRPDVRGMLAAMTTAAKMPGRQAGKDMEDSARIVLEDWARRRNAAREAGEAEPAQSAAELLAIDVARRGQIMQLTADYDALGNPPWDPDKADRASELQAQLFFLEGGIAQGKLNYETPRLGGESGASGSWWIERQETGEDGKPKGKKKYIYKPGKTEAAAITGLPPGAGAPREVLAKRLDEFMAGAGFNVGVSPTTLASISGTQLGSMEGGPGPQLGSMQQLADADGTVESKFHSDARDAFMANVDKNSFDGIAVFDMIFANLDRHGGNLLYKTDPDTGRHTLLPIDHGSSMLTPDQLQANAEAFFGARNFMARDEVPQAMAPLGPETLESLQRLDPDRMVQEMKQARDDMARRHPETHGTMSDAAIEGMGARVRFIKAAAATTPVADIFKMLGLGAKRIANCLPEDLDHLVATLKDEVAEAETAQRQFAEVGDAMMATGFNGTDGPALDRLQELGWAWNMTKSAMADWVLSNRKLVGRILGAQMVNPALQKEIDRLLPLAKQADPNIERKIRTSLPGVKFEELYNTVNAGFAKGPAPATDFNALSAEFEQLGGMAEMRKAALDFPADFESVMEIEPGNSERRVQALWVSRVTKMRQWAALKAKGGIAAVLDAGGTIPRESRMLTIIRTIEELTLSRDATRQVLDLAEEDLPQAIIDKYQELDGAVTGLLVDIISLSTRQKFLDRQHAAQGVWKAGKTIGATTAMGGIMRSVEAAIAGEAASIRSMVEAEQKMDEQLQQEPENVRQEMQQHMPGIRQLLQTARDQMSLQHSERAGREFRGRIEIAKLGAESEYRKFEAALNAIAQRIAGHAGMGWAQALADKLASVRNNLAAFDLGTMTYTVDTFNAALDSLDKIKAALGNTDLNALPQPVQAIVNDWAGRLENFNSVQGGDKSAADVRELLAQPVT
jgi:hypothetical protein